VCCAVVGCGALLLGCERGVDPRAPESRCARLHAVCELSSPPPPAPPPPSPAKIASAPLQCSYLHRDRASVSAHSNQLPPSVSVLQIDDILQHGTITVGA